MTKQSRPAGPGRPKSVQKHEAILSAAASLFCEFGLQTVSMDAIAKRAKVSKLTIYNHFGDKESLFAEAVEVRIAQFLPAEILQDTPQLPIAKQLHRICMGYLDLLTSTETVQLYRTIIAQAGQNNQFGRLFHSIGPAKLQLELATFFAQATATNRLNCPEPATASRIFLSLTKELIQIELLLGISKCPSQEQLRKHANTVVASFLTLFGPLGS